jgi:glycosyltransferase involved in cell wall biosynthesis
MDQQTCSRVTTNQSSEEKGKSRKAKRKSQAQTIFIKLLWSTLLPFAFYLFTLKVLHISSARSFGGGERHLADLANGLAERGHDVSVVLSLSSPLHERLAALPQGNIVGLRLRHALDVASARALARIVRERRIEVIHAHVARDYTLAAYAARKTRTPFVITRHVLFPMNRLHRFALAKVSRVIAVSEAVARSLHAQKIFPAEKIKIIPNAIDVERFDAHARGFNRAASRHMLQLPKERRLVGTVGEIKPLKGQEDFLRAAAIIARKAEDVDFIIAGEDFSGAREHRARLERLINELNLKGRVHLTGWLDDVAPLLLALDVYVSASRSESFGLSIVEAMASGVAVVATATEGAQEVIDDGSTGKIVAVGNVEALAEAIGLLLEDAAERERLASLAHASARERFNIARMVQATEQVYEETKRIGA